MKLEDIKCIGVVGAGLMGSGIAQTAILADYKVICRDLTDEIIQKARNEIVSGRFGLKGGVERGKQTQEQMDQALANLTLTTKVEDLKNCDLVIEAVGGGEDGALESMPVKLKVFAELDKIVKKEAIFASNTSNFHIADLITAMAVERKKKFVGMHWFRPANIMRLVELIYTPDTSEEVVQVMEGVCQRLGKTSVRMKDAPWTSNREKYPEWADTSSINNRIWHATTAEGQKIIDEGIATAEDINTAMMLGRNWPEGPMRARRPGERPARL